MAVVGSGIGVGLGVTGTGVSDGPAVSDGAADVVGDAEGEGARVAAEHPNIEAMTTVMASATAPRLDDGRAVKFAYLAAAKILLLGVADRCVGIMHTQTRDRHSCVVSRAGCRAIDGIGHTRAFSRVSDI